MASILRDIQVEVHGVHLRYEDPGSDPSIHGSVKVPAGPCAGGMRRAPFALGLTLASLVTAPSTPNTAPPASQPTEDSATRLPPSAPVATPDIPRSLLLDERRSARLSLLALYWDPLEPRGWEAASDGGVFAALPRSPGTELTAAFAAGIMTKSVSAAWHRYVIHPTSPRLELVRAAPRVRYAPRQPPPTRGDIATAARLSADSRRTEVGSPASPAPPAPPPIAAGQGWDAFDSFGGEAGARGGGDTSTTVMNDRPIPHAAALTASLDIAQLEVALSRTQLLQAAALRSWIEEQAALRVLTDLRSQVRRFAMQRLAR